MKGDSKKSAATNTNRTATFLVYDGMWRSGGIQSIIVRTIVQMESRGEAVWLVSDTDQQILGVAEARLLVGRSLIDHNWSSSSAFANFDEFRIVGFGPQAAPIAYLLESAIKTARGDASVFMAINVLHPNEFMMTDEKPHVHSLNRLLALSVSPCRLVFMNEQCRATHSAFLSRDLTSNLIIPVPIDERKPCWAGPSEGGPLRIVCVGRIVNFKAYNFALPRILAKLAKEGSDVTCDIFGYGSEEAKLADLVKLHGVEDVLKFHGPIPLEKFDDIVSRYDLFIGMGTAALQAAQLGVPTILAIVDDEHGAHGFIDTVPFGNLGEADPSTPRHDLKKLIEAYLDASLEEREKISLNGISYANRYVSDDYVEQLTQSSIPHEGVSRHLAAFYCRFYLWMARDNWLRKSVRFAKNMRRSTQLP